ncbi:MAG TPA: hypothetical protein DCX32_02010 [Candidatus Moranbacteria bacterium]|nr:hypothetical protein [Candidatus Moranbacteria bacterium]
MWAFIVVIKRQRTPYHSLIAYPNSQIFSRGSREEVIGNREETGGKFSKKGVADHKRNSGYFFSIFF